MPENEINQRMKSMEAIQYKILQEAMKNKEVQASLAEELQAVRSELMKSLNNEKQLLLHKQKQDAKVKELEEKVKEQAEMIKQQGAQLKQVEKRYNNLKSSKMMRLTYKYWDLRKKIGSKGK